MFKENTQKLYIAFIAVITLSFGSMASVYSQQIEFGLIQLNIVKVKPDMDERFRGIHRDFFMPSGLENGMPWRVTSSIVFGDSFNYFVATPLANYAALDASPFISGEGDTDVDMANSIWRTSVDSRRSLIIQGRPDLSMEQVPAADQSRLIRVVAKPDKGAEFEEYWLETAGLTYTAFGTVGSVDLATDFELTTQEGREFSFQLVVPAGVRVTTDGLSTSPLNGGCAIKARADIPSLTDPSEREFVNMVPTARMAAVESTMTTPFCFSKWSE